MNAQFDRWINNQLQLGIGPNIRVDELAEYLSLGKQASIKNAASWWHDRKPRFPTLAQLALDLWAIPAMADDCERTFSQAKLSITSQRGSMSVKVLEEIQCFKQWSRHEGRT